MTAARAAGMAVADGAVVTAAAATVGGLFGACELLPRVSSTAATAPPATSAATSPPAIAAGLWERRVCVVDSGRGALDPGTVRAAAGAVSAGGATARGSGEHGGEGARGRWAGLRVFGERSVDRGVHMLGEPWAAVPQRRRRLVRLRVENAGGVAEERGPAGEQMIGEDAERIDVGGRPGRVAAHLFGRHVLRCAQAHAGLR